MSFLCLLGVSALSVCSLCVSAQQRMCEQLTRVVDIVAGLPPFQATFEKAPVSERLVIVMALGPYAQVQSDTSGHVRAQFSKFAAANSADLLRLSLRCPLPGLMLQAAQLAMTQIEEFILNCHQAGQECITDGVRLRQDASGWRQDDVRKMSRQHQDVVRMASGWRQGTSG